MIAAPRPSPRAVHLRRTQLIARCTSLLSRWSGPKYGQRRRIDNAAISARSVFYPPRHSDVNCGRADRALSSYLLFSFRAGGSLVSNRTHARLGEIAKREKCRSFGPLVVHWSGRYARCADSRIGFSRPVGCVALPLPRASR